ncbi:MAG: hypothetical protein RMK51_03630 [Meiothermus sp.]|uniref:hypothetical protein n=1 Tax=Meiothermus sp. TaxID=1955249 RepID=UPI0025E291A0|nr:hypothetical protein [Meiothermus sp.]MCS7069337.1 hypothetical protein [Meiothermus sp.]MDW8424999.1 hypothetical protein [Meiothermus sp.]
MQKLAMFMAAVIFSLAFAQAESIPTDLSQWFASTAALAAVVAALVALLRKHVLKALDGLAVVAVSIALGGILGYVGKLAGYLGPDWLIFGLSAGVMASGGIDLVRGITGRGSAPSGNTAADADRARLR